MRLAADALGEAPDDPELLAVATDAAWRLNFLDEALGTAAALGAGRRGAADRIEAMRFVARLHIELSDAARERDAAREALERFAESLEAPELRGPRAAHWPRSTCSSATRRRRSRGPSAPSADADVAGDDGTATRAQVEAASAMIGAPAGRRRRLRCTTRSSMPAGSATRAVCRALSNRLELVPPNSLEGRALRAELLDASRRVGIDKLGHERAPAVGADAAYARRRSGGACAEPTPRAEQWWGARDEDSCSVRRLAGELRPRGRPAAADARRLIDGSRASDAVRTKPTARCCCGCSWPPRDDDRAAGSGAFAALAAGRVVPDVNSALNYVVTVAEAALAAGVATGRVRAELLDGWIGDHPSAGLFRAHVEGLLLATEGEHAAAVEALDAVLDDPEQRSPGPCSGCSAPRWPARSPPPAIAPARSGPCAMCSTTTSPAGPGCGAIGRWASPAGSKDRPPGPTVS